MSRRRFLLTGKQPGALDESQSLRPFDQEVAQGIWVVDRPRAVSA